MTRDEQIELLARALCYEDVVSPDFDRRTPEHQADYRKTATALLDQIAPLTAVKVKPLVWEPIDTAPRDGVWFAARTASVTARIVHYADKYDRYPIAHDYKIWSTAPTEWTPLARVLSAVDAVSLVAERAACTEELRLAVAAARAEERELAAKVAEGCPDSHWAWWVAAAIRARSEGGEG